MINAFKRLFRMTTANRADVERYVRIEYGPGNDNIVDDIIKASRR